MSLFHVRALAQKTPGARKNSLAKALLGRKIRHSRGLSAVKLDISTTGYFSTS